MESFYSSNFDNKPEVPSLVLDQPSFNQPSTQPVQQLKPKRPSAETREILNKIDSQDDRPATTATRFDQFMNFLGNIEQEFSVASHRSVLADSSRIAGSTISNDEFGNPKEAYTKVRERMIELEMEKEEHQKALEVVKKLRQKERDELVKRVDLAKEEGQKTAEQVKAEMAARIEKQVQMIEDLLQDKKTLSAKVEELIQAEKETVVQMEKQKKWQDERLQVELRKNKEAWMASEKVRKEKWEKERIHEIRA